MKRIITSILAALLLLVFSAPSQVGATEILESPRNDLFANDLGLLENEEEIELDSAIIEEILESENVIPKTRCGTCTIYKNIKVTSSSITARKWTGLSLNTGSQTSITYTWKHKSGLGVNHKGPTLTWKGKTYYRNQATVKFSYTIDKYTPAGHYIGKESGTVTGIVGTEWSTTKGK